MKKLMDMIAEQQKNMQSVSDVEVKDELQSTTAEDQIIQ